MGRPNKLDLLIPVGMALILGWGLIDLYVVPTTVGRPATVFYAPWTSRAAAIARATSGARLLRTGWFPFAVTVIPDASAYADVARQSGAWFVASFATRAGCGFAAP